MPAAGDAGRCAVVPAVKLIIVMETKSDPFHAHNIVELVGITVPVVADAFSIT
jgi:hypothetical protein